MKKSDNPADPFKKALTEATRAMAEDHELNVTFSADPSGVSGDTMRLPQVSRRLTRDDFPDMPGVTRQILNRELKTLEKQGLLTIAYSRITLHDVQQLRSMAVLTEVGPAATG